MFFTLLTIRFLRVLTRDQQKYFPRKSSKSNEISNIFLFMKIYLDKFGVFQQKLKYSSGHFFGLKVTDN